MDQGARDGEDGAQRDADKAAQRRRVARAVEDFQRGVEREKNFRFLYETFYQPVRRFLGRRVSTPEDRLDLTQETFLRVYRGLEGYRGDAQFGTWVFRIAYNTYLKWLRRVSGTEAQIERSAESLTTAIGEDEEPIAVAAEDSPLEDALGAERRARLRQAIEELPTQMRRCAELRIRHDLSYREIATVMGRSIETVKVHLFQARKKLKEALHEIDL